MDAVNLGIILGGLTVQIKNRKTIAMNASFTGNSINRSVQIVARK